MVSGPSGVGKGTLVARLREQEPGLGLTVSATTRAPREGEVEGTSSEYQVMIDHLNGNKMDWSLANLEEVTPEENRKRAKILRILRSIGRDPKQMSREELLRIFAKYTFTNPKNID